MEAVGTVKVKVKDMTPAQRRAWLSAIGRRGGKSRAQQFTPASQRAARRRLSPEQAAENGRKGARATMDKYGHERLFEAARQKRLRSPSRKELVMVGVLSQLGLRPEREYRLGTSFYTLDFYLAECGLGIEVDGSIHDAGKPMEMKRRDWAQRKAALCRQMGIRLLTVHHTELGDDLAPVIGRIQSALANEIAESCIV